MVFRPIGSLAADVIGRPGKEMAERLRSTPVAGEGGAPGEMTAGSASRDQPADALARGGAEAARMGKEKARPAGRASDFGGWTFRRTIAPTLRPTIEHKCDGTHPRPQSHRPMARVPSHLCLYVHQRSCMSR
jgi:hypothetical protein